MAAISDETQKSDHKDYGMFVLVIMSHGDTNDRIFGADGKTIQLAEVLDLLSPLNFPTMAGKPKLVVIQACSGSKYHCTCISFISLIDIYFGQHYSSKVLC